MGHDWLLPLAAAVVDLLIGAGVLARTRRDRAAWTFALMTACMAAWNFGLAALQGLTDPAAAELWSRLCRVGICFAPVASYHFCLVLADAPTAMRRRLLVGGYAVAGVLAVLDLAGFLVTGVTPHRWGWYPQVTPLYSGLTAVILLYPLLCVRVMWQRWRVPMSARQRAQVGCWFVAGLVHLPFIATNLLGLYGIETWPLGSLGNALALSIVAYAIVRHRFMDVDWLVRKVIGFSLASGVVLVPGAILLSSIIGTLDDDVALPVGFGAAVLGLVASAVVPALQRGIERRIQQMLFPDRFDSRRRLRELASTLVHELDEARLLARLGDTLTDVLALDACAVLALDEQARGLVAAHTTEGAPLPSAETLAVLETLSAPTLADELETTAPDVAEALQAQGWAVVMPLRANGGLCGLGLLGENRDLRLVSAEDLGLLDTVAAAAGVAIANARLSKELRRSEVVLQRASRLSSLGMLAAGIAHEIRNPLVAVKTFLDLLPQRLDDAEFVRSFRDLSLNELRRVTDLITDLLALGKGSRTERREVDLAQTLEPVIRLMDSTARKRQVRLDAQLAGHLPTVWADADQLKQITLNLILNAIEASPPDSTVTVVIAPDEDGASILVRDQGCGIPAAELEGIFEPFFTTKEGGTGLGLALVHQMVVEHGGEITVESAAAAGTTFRVRLPPARVSLEQTGT